MTTIKAHFDGKAFVPDERVNLPADQQVTLQVDPRAAAGQPRRTREELLKGLQDLRRMAEESDASEADFSRDSIYSGNLDDTR